MNIIIGAAGRIGSNVVKKLVKHQVPVRAVFHETECEFDKSVHIVKADLLNINDVIKAFEGGTTAFLLTPEKHDVEDVIEDTRKIIDNYKIAIKETGIKRIVGLSCGGAQIEKGTGNVLLSRMLEQAFTDMDIKKIFVRPSYYYSNWLGYLDLINESGILPTFFPADLAVEMHSPVDVAKFVSQCILKDDIENKTEIFELLGYKKYTSKDIAAIFSEKLKKEVNLQIIAEEDRIPILRAVGFTENTAQNMSDMTQAVIDKRITLEFEDKAIKMTTPFGIYLDDILKLKQ